MIKIFKNIALVASLCISFTVSAQTTVNSPYSQFGLGDLKGKLLPQNRAMGGISSGLRTSGGLNNINYGNPASYSAINFTTFDIGAYSGFNELSKSSVSENNFTASLSHITFAVPVTKTSALSLGLVPFSNLGYQYRTSAYQGSTRVDYLYVGQGGLSKAYLGYGFALGKHVSLGANASYLFGKLSETSSSEFPSEPDVLNSKTENSRSVGGLALDYGIQYYTNLTPKVHLTIGYSGGAGTSVRTTYTSMTTRYQKNFNTGDISTSLDTSVFVDDTRRDIKLPMTHSVGFTLQDQNKWLFGSDFSIGNWSDYREGRTNPGLTDSYSISAGGQYTPDINSVTSYLNLVDYRLGFKYDKTYIQVKKNDIKQMALTFGLGLPLPSNPGRTAFYKINVAAEVGQRGTNSGGLVRERFVNVYIGFTLNDKWFQKFKFD